MSSSLWPHGLQHAMLPCPSRHASLSFTVYEFSQIRVYWVSDAMQPSHPLLPPSPFVFNFSPPSGSFSSESALHIMWPNCWSFSFSISPPKEYSGLISLRVDWFDILAVQGTLKSLLQQHTSKVSVLWRSALKMHLSQLKQKREIRREIPFQ